MTTLAPITSHEGSADPRDPLLRLTNFFDEGTMRLLHPRDRSGVQTAVGSVNGVTTVAYCTDGTVMGGAMGVVGCAHIVDAIDTAIAEQAPVVGIWHSGGARLAEGVEAWGFRLMQARREFLSREQVAESWFEQEYEPVTEMMRAAVGVSTSGRGSGIGTPARTHVRQTAASAPNKPTRVSICWRGWKFLKRYFSILLFFFVIYFL